MEPIAATNLSIEKFCAKLEESDSLRGAVIYYGKSALCGEMT
jgi:hypothetical protein